MSETTLNGNVPTTSSFVNIDDIIKQQTLATQATNAAKGYQFSPTKVDGVDYTSAAKTLNGGAEIPGDGGSWFNSGNISAAAGLASALTQAIALPEQLKNMRLQRKSMEHNLATAKEEQARRNKNISGFNSFQNIKGA